MDNDDLTALEIIKKHIRYFKKPVDINDEKISIYLLKNSTYEKVEKQRGWRL